MLWRPLADKTSNSSRVYTGGTDSLVRLWRADLGADQEPDVAVEAAEAITSLATGVCVERIKRRACLTHAQRDCWFSGSTDTEVRRYEHAIPEMSGLVTSANGVPIRCAVVDPQGKKIAVTSECVALDPINLDIHNREVSL